MNSLEQLPVVKIQARRTGGKFVEVLVDGDYDGEYFSQFHWRLTDGGYVYRTYRPKGGPTKTVYLAREVAKPPKGWWVSFKNSNKLDCRSANLEVSNPKAVIARRHQRRFKKDLSGPTASIYRGVCRPSSKDGNGYRWVSKTKWVAMCRGEVIGYFEDEIEAALAYDKKARELWGEKAVVNFPEDMLPKIVEDAKREEDGKGGHTFETRNTGERPKYRYYARGKNICRWCGRYVEQPNIYHDDCLKAKRRTQEQ